MIKNDYGDRHGILGIFINFYSCFVPGSIHHYELSVLICRFF